MGRKLLGESDGPEVTYALSYFLKDALGIVLRIAMAPGGAQNREILKRPRERCSKPRYISG